MPFSHELNPIFTLIGKRQPIQILSDSVHQAIETWKVETIWGGFQVAGGPIERKGRNERASASPQMFF